ncbi:MAG TPA: ABC transporter ATP-binding protein [Candidatus Bathyarchaeota archaeon]|nr:MAG: ABC transporter ATP-binding protein [Candidatus Bathyarchaeota archaeon]HDM89195.1 ABC transporter ATP-binding protein [Candidatus Bathyarchaeota archaeon]
MSDSILVTKGLMKRFGKLVAVNDVSIDVKRGAFAILFGPNGAGKTTLVNVITGYLKKDSGRVWFDGKEITNLSAAETFEMGLARSFQIPRIFPRLTVLENILLAEKSPGESFIKAPFKFLWKKAEEELVERAFQVLKMIGLEDQWDKLGGELSGGDMKLLDVGKALMSNAKMILIDEPIAGVHPSYAHNILDHLQKIKEARDLTILMVEHRLDIALKYVDYAYAMAGGRIIAEGDPYRLIRMPEVVESYLGEKYRLG